MWLAVQLHLVFSFKLNTHVQRITWTCPIFQLWVYSASPLPHPLLENFTVMVSHSIVRHHYTLDIARVHRGIARLHYALSHRSLHYVLASLVFITHSYLSYSLHTRIARLPFALGITAIFSASAWHPLLNEWFWKRLGSVVQFVFRWWKLVINSPTHRKPRE